MNILLVILVLLVFFLSLYFASNIDTILDKMEQINMLYFIYVSLFIITCCFILITLKLYLN